MGGSTSKKALQRERFLKGNLVNRLSDVFTVTMPESKGYLSPVWHSAVPPCLSTLIGFLLQIKDAS